MNKEIYSSSNKTSKSLHIFKININLDTAPPLWSESGVFGFNDKCEMCLKVVGENNYFFMSFTSEKWLQFYREFSDISTFLRNSKYSP